MELLIIVPNMEKKLVAADVCVGGGNYARTY